MNGFEASSWALWRSLSSLEDAMIGLQRDSENTEVCRRYVFEDLSGMW